MERLLWYLFAGSRGGPTRIEMMHRGAPKRATARVGLVAFAVTCAMLFAGCLSPTDDTADNLWPPGCHFVPPGKQQPDCAPDSIELRDVGQVPTTWFCSSPPFAGLRFFTAPGLDQFGLHVTVGETSYPPIDGQPRSAVIQVEGSEGDGLYSWAVPGEQSFTIFPQWLGAEVSWRMDLIGIDYRVRGLAEDADEPRMHPIWKTTPGQESKDYANFLLLHSVEAAGAHYFFENNVYAEVESPFGDDVIAGYGYHNVQAATAAFDFDVRTVEHISASTGIPMNIATPDRECLSEGVTAPPGSWQQADAADPAQSQAPPTETV